MMIADKAGKSAREYAAICIDMHTDQILILA
jgi:hypothetical protein